MQTKNRIIYITDKPSAEQQLMITEALGSCQCLPSIDELLRLAPKVDAIILSPTVSQPSAFANLRQSIDYFTTPIFLTEPLADDNWSDGNFSDMRQVEKQLLEINKKRQQITAPIVNWQTKLLAYLYCRPDTTLIPQSHWNHVGYYYYPLVELFSNAPDNYWLWLNEGIQQGIVSKTRCIDQMICCSGCRSPHLKFTEHCPKCNSYELNYCDFLHCFTCGLVAPQQEFIHQERLQCPKCHAQLRHIADDYDRPLESGQCMDCHDYFMDASVKVSCMVCHKTSLPEQLSKTMIYQLALTEKAQRQLQFAEQQSQLSIFDKINYAAPDFFYATVDWLSAMSQRYEEEVFTLIGINLTGIDKQDDLFVYDLAEHLKKLLRKTDLLTRVNERVIWILLPKTDKAGADIVVSRINTFIENAPARPAGVSVKAFVGKQKQTEASRVLLAKLATDL